MIRRTNDFSGFSGGRPDAPKKFMAPPAFLRKNADFGGDLELRQLRERRRLFILLAEIWRTIERLALGLRDGAGVQDVIVDVER
ncbi:hypothetical protein [Bradyrhizobium sp. AS23.2]|uniref:hypothetical protein n=1 Tax=Bradyrhizobium sp. AS23.2 TaxID=1680155 RepID=UPI00093C5030|nr:hypothetical protein [Bradyrhizobium sp. AS23.2]OKO85300.1 hypothetical protein AC630_06410 [Bradyrhizobium sp. AS23.2]